MIRSATLLPSISHNTGGFFQSVRRLSQNLIQQNVKMEVFAVRDQGTGDALAEWNPVPVNVFTRRGPRGYYFGTGLARALVEGDFDLLHRHGLWRYPSLACTIWHRKTRKPYVISPRGMLDSWALRNSYWQKRVMALFQENGFLRHASCLHALCESEAESIRKYGLRNPICVIPNGTDLPAPSGGIQHPSSILHPRPDGRRQSRHNQQVGPGPVCGGIERRRGVRAQSRTETGFAAPTADFENGVAPIAPVS